MSPEQENAAQRTANASFNELGRAWRLYKSLQDKAKFDNLSLDEKLEALRIAAIQKGGKS